MTQFARNAAKPARFPFSPVPTDRSCAAIASEATGNFKGTSFTGCAFSTSGITIFRTYGTNKKGTCSIASAFV
jgi:hypothetical protein